MLEAKFKQLPRDIQVALTSTEVTADMKKIASDNGLLLDQASVLFDLVSYVLLGLVPSGQFVKTFSKEAKVDAKVATAIAQTINEKVFSKIRASIQKIESNRSEISEQESESRRQNITALETAGGFSVVKEKSQPVNVTGEDRPKILAGLENPAPVKEVRAGKLAEENYTEPLVDQLLNASTTDEDAANDEVKSAVPNSMVPPMSSKSAVPPILPAVDVPISVPKYGLPEKDSKPKSSDSYREPV